MLEESVKPPLKQSRLSQRFQTEKSGSPRTERKPFIRFLSVMRSRGALPDVRDGAM